MKKLMIAAAIVCAAAVSQAANWNWSCSGTSSKKTWYDGDSSTLLYSTSPDITIYLFDAATIEQDNLLDGIRAGTISLDTAGSLKTTSIDSDSKMVSQAITPVPGASGDHVFFMAAIDAAGKLFISDGVTTTIQTGQADTPISFGSINAATQAFKGDGDYAGAGWYAVPEPTSGLLLLLGVAGLALRRRRA